MRVGVIGPTTYPSFRIRGAPLAAAHGWETLDVSQPIPGRFDVLWLVKRRPGADLEAVRRACDRLIVDPLDWWSSPPTADYVTWWNALYNEIIFDEVVVTSPAGHECFCAWLLGFWLSGMQLGPHHPRCHLLPHPCDGRIAGDWHDPHGPIVYAGSRCFLGDPAPWQAAAAKLGRELRIDYSQHNAWRSLRGAALQLCVRVPPHDCEWNRWNRPQIKLENSAAAGVPLIYNGHPCETSLHPNHPAVHPAQLGDVDWLAGELDQALTSGPPRTCYRPEHFHAEALQIVEHGQLQGSSSCSGNRTSAACSSPTASARQ